MRRSVLVALLLTIGIAAPRAQDALTANQRDTDLIQLASRYAKFYAPYEWKRDVIGFDLYRLTPWLQRIHHSDDLDFQEALREYVASLGDAHASIVFPSPFTASLGFTVDIYDGKVLIDSVNRSLLPSGQYPFGLGDELVALDGEPVESLIASFGKYAAAGNERSRDRRAAGLIVARSQQIMPHASQLGGTAIASIRLSSTGALNTFVIPWVKTGIGVDSQGPLPAPRRGNGLIFRDPETIGVTAAVQRTRALLHPADLRVADNTLPAYMEPILPLLNGSVPWLTDAVLGVGARSPIYAVPAGFVTRLGMQPSHFFFSGVYVSNGVRIGLLRIPTISPPNTALALQQLDQEIAFFNANTDVLVVDITRNPGGILPTAEAFAQRLIPKPFRTIGFEVRAVANWVTAFADRLTSALRSGAPPDVIQNFRAIFNEVLRAYNEERGRTAPIPLNAIGSLELPSAPGAYAKPLLVLVDEFSVSSADMLAAILQDNHRGPLLGMRTMGAGGSVVGGNCTAFTESVCTFTVSLMNRGIMISTPDYPPTPYIENVGVRPDIVVDYMTRANLMTRGAPFVEAFTQAAVKLVTK